MLAINHRQEGVLVSGCFCTIAGVYTLFVIPRVRYCVTYNNVTSCPPLLHVCYRVTGRKRLFFLPSSACYRVTGRKCLFFLFFTIATMWLAEMSLFPPAAGCSLPCDLQKTAVFPLPPHVRYRVTDRSFHFFVDHCCSLRLCES